MPRCYISVAFRILSLSTVNGVRHANTSRNMCHRWYLVVHGRSRGLVCARDAASKNPRWASLSLDHRFVGASGHPRCSIKLIHIGPMLPPQTRRWKSVTEGCKGCRFHRPAAHYGADFFSRHCNLVAVVHVLGAAQHDAFSSDLRISLRRPIIAPPVLCTYVRTKLCAISYSEYNIHISGSVRSLKRKISFGSLAFLNQAGI